MTRPPAAPPAQPPAPAPAPRARYDGLAAWYDGVMTDPADRRGLATIAFGIVVELLGPGGGVVLDLGTGTGLSAGPLRAAGYQPVGLDLSIDQLRIAAGRLPVAQADAARLPLADDSVPAAYSTFVSSALDDFPRAVAEVYRVLAPGGRYVPVCLHPCFDGNYVEKRPDGTIVQHPGYRDSGFAEPGHFSSTVRGKTGSWHRPLSDQLNTYLQAGFELLRVAEDGADPLPNQLALLLRKPR
jgi:SAM-dependent methyltransferase